MSIGEPFFENSIKPEFENIVKSVVSAVSPSFETVTQPLISKIGDTFCEGLN